MTETYLRLRKEIPNLKLVLVPRHVERAADIVEMLKRLGVRFSRRSSGGEAAEPADVLLADTTGEMLKLMNGADLVIMGKSLAGHDEGHNLIEPALLSKPIGDRSRAAEFPFYPEGAAAGERSGDRHRRRRTLRTAAEAADRREDARGAR